MENSEKLAVISIIVEDEDAPAYINALLHLYRDYIKGRMGLPCITAQASVICIIMLAPADVINTVTGKLGMIKGVKAKTLQK